MAVQDHIHLALTLGGTPEFAPVYKWAVRFPDYALVPDHVMSLQRTLSGALEKHVLRDANGPLQFNNYKFTVRVGADYGYTVDDRITQLRAMGAKAVYFCPPGHPADAADHTSAIRAMFVSKIGQFQPFDPLMQRFYADIELVDDYTA